MSYETLTYENEGELGILTYDRPEVVNAVNRQMLEDMLHFWEERQGDFDTRVIIVKGAGEKGFNSGLDLKAATDTETGFARGGMTPDTIYNNQCRFSKVLRLMRSCPQPIIAAVHGYAMGAGLSYAMASDVRLASPDAVFCAQYINIGVGGADLGSSYFLWRIVGWGRAAEMCMTGNRVTAEEALRMGLVNHVYDREELEAKAREMARVMLSKSKIGLRMTKEALNASLGLSSLEDANKIEDRNQAFIIASGFMSGNPPG